MRNTPTPPPSGGDCQAEFSRGKILVDTGIDIALHFVAQFGKLRRCAVLVARDKIGYAVAQCVTDFDQFVFGVLHDVPLSGQFNYTDLT